MKVRELIEMLASQPLDREVYLSRDPEGNGFAPLSGHSDEYAVDSMGELQESDKPVLVLWS